MNSFVKEGYKIRFVPWDPKFAPIVFNWYYDVTYKLFFREMDAPYTVDDLKKFDLIMGRAGVRLFMVLDKETSTPIGMVTHYCLKGKAGVNRIGIMMDKKHQHKTYTIEALIILGDYLYNRMGFNKLVIEFLAKDSHIRRIAEKGGWKYEATLVSETVVDGQRVDEVRYYMFKDTYLELYGNYFEVLELQK